MPARYSLLQVELTGGDLTPAGILLEDSDASRLHLRLRRDWHELAGEDECEILDALAADFERKASPADLGAQGVLDYLEDTQSNFLRITTPQAIERQDYDRALNRLYREQVQTNVLPFRTHLPVYSLRAAAGKFLENDEITEESWLDAPADLRLTPEMFAAWIAGQSMEPLIPDGSLCIFRHGVVGSRGGKLVLAEDRQATGNNRYAIKRYSSEKTATEEGWQHTRIRLESLNPSYRCWDLDPEEDKYAIIAEFVRVVE
jgi:phage repressor protein C with HTH and peptisase S24 domain